MEAKGEVGRKKSENKLGRGTICVSPSSLEAPSASPSSPSSLEGQRGIEDTARKEKIWRMGR